jgi:hypothetical protein
MVKSSTVTRPPRRTVDHPAFQLVQPFVDVSPAFRQLDPPIRGSDLLIGAHPAADTPPDLENPRALRRRVVQELAKRTADDFGRDYRTVFREACDRTQRADLGLRRQRRMQRGRGAELALKEPVGPREIRLGVAARLVDLDIRAGWGVPARHADVEDAGVRPVDPAHGLDLNGLGAEMRHGIARQLGYDRRKLSSPSAHQPEFCNSAASSRARMLERSYR